MHIVKIRFASRVLFLRTQIAVTLPDHAVEDGHKRKVLWLLHGAGLDCCDCIQNAAFHTAMEHRDMIVVAPSNLNSDYGAYDCFGTGYDFPKFFFEELMPFIYGTFPASSAPEDNYIAGASMGGYGAMMLGLLHPEKFAGIAAFGSSLRESEFLKAYLDKPMSAFRQDALSHPKDFPTEYGPPEFGIKRKEVNVISKYPSVQAFFDSPECMWNRFPEVVQAGNLPKLYIACGTKDLFYPTTKRFEAMASALHVTDAKFCFAEGVGHEEAYFDAQVGESLTWFGL